jgi:hypothetical protein
MKRITCQAYPEASAGLQHDQVAPLLLDHFDEGLSFPTHTSQSANNFVMLVQKFLHVLMTTISFLNPFVIQLHLNEEDTDMKAQIS